MYIFNQVWENLQKLIVQVVLIVRLPKACDFWCGHEEYQSLYISEQHLDQGQTHWSHGGIFNNAYM